MLTKKLPETNEERINVLRAILNQEELNEDGDKVLSMSELHELRLFTTSFEGADFILTQAIIDRNKAQRLYDDLFKNAQMYVSHFIQVLLLTVIRNEIKSEFLVLYGFNEKNSEIPDLSTEEAILKWGENIMQGETERIYKRGIPLYNPAIAKVKVHYELFKEAIYSLTIYEKNLLRSQTGMKDLRKQADDYILNVWSKVEAYYYKYPQDEQTQRFRAYKIQLTPQKVRQLNVFD